MIVYGTNYCDFAGPLYADGANDTESSISLHRSQPACRPGRKLSPDGSKIAFFDNSSDPSGALYTMKSPRNLPGCKPGRRLRLLTRRYEVRPSTVAGRYWGDGHQRTKPGEADERGTPLMWDSRRPLVVAGRDEDRFQQVLVLGSDFRHLHDEGRRHLEGPTNVTNTPS